MAKKNVYGRWRIGGSLGEGGQAYVYFVEDWSCPGSVDGELLSRSSLHPLRGGYRDSTPGVDRRS